MPCFCSLKSINIHRSNKVKKDCEKVLTIGNKHDIIVKLSHETATRTLKIKQREDKKEPVIPGATAPNYEWSLTDLHKTVDARKGV